MVRVRPMFLRLGLQQVRVHEVKEMLQTALVCDQVYRGPSDRARL